MKTFILAAALSLGVVGAAYAANENSSCNAQANAAVKEAIAENVGSGGGGLGTLKKSPDPFLAEFPTNELAKARNEFRNVSCDQQP